MQPQGFRPLSPPLQEDAHAAVLGLNADAGGKSALFAVLDGHGGAEVARFVANHLVSATCCVCLGMVDDWHVVELGLSGTITLWISLICHSSLHACRQLLSVF
jgi:hypothetical protein